MYELVQHLHTLDADIEPPDELSIAWRQMIRMEKPSKRRIDTNVRIFIAVAALVAILFGGATLVHVGLIPGAARVENAGADGLFPPGSDTVYTNADQGGLLAEGDAQQIQSVADAQRRLRSGSYTVKTNNFDDDKDAILKLTLQYGGWAQYEAVSGLPLTRDGKGGRFCSLQIRMPEKSLGGFLRALDSIVDVEDSELQQQDYTDQYAEMTTKLASCKNQLDRFIQLLGETSSIEEKMTIERGISDTEAQISSIQATLENWDARALFSQIDIAMTETADPIEALGVTLWGRMRTQFGMSARAVGNYFMDMLVFITIAAPWILVVVIMAGTALLVEKWHWRSRQP
ncbi:MAG: DUF4349 domain-containing protein [Oscillospiraceae bacterium]|jgi:hypothetical protein|nr:DUF4349 domain-containing protein [Oscillospiraceae bacterium]